MTERLYNYLTVGLALSAVSPKREEVMRFTNFDNPVLWKKRPYVHEFALVRASFGLLERHGELDKSFCENMAFVLEWIGQLNKSQLKERNGRAEPLFLDLDSKDQINQQIINLRRPDAAENPFTSITLSVFLGGCAKALSEFQIMDNGGAPSGPAPEQFA